MNENSITRFEVSNFKKFDHLIVENIGQVNLITGDNNVGKTTLLEALVFSEDNSFWIKYLHQRLDVRNINFHLENIHAESPKFPNENFLHYILSDIKKRLVCKFELQKGDTEELALEYRQIGDIDVELQKYRKDNYKVFNVPDWVVFYKGGKIDELQWLYRDDMDKSIRDNLYMPFISSFNSLDDDFQRNVDSLNFDEKEFVIKSLKKWIPDLKDFDYGQVGTLNLARFATGTNNIYQPITTFGDGVQYIFKCLVGIIYAGRMGEDRIMIDEIDTGIHYLKMKEFWNAIIYIAQRRGIQIFATTHSMDCIKAFVEAGEENELIKNDLRLIELEEFTNKDGIIKHTATTFNHETLKYKIEMNTNVLGGDVWR